MTDKAIQEKMDDVIGSVSKATGVDSASVGKVLQQLGLEGAVANRVELRGVRPRVSLSAIVE